MPHPLWFSRVRVLTLRLVRPSLQRVNHPHIYRSKRSTIHHSENAFRPRISTIPCKTLYLSANEMLPCPMFSSQSSPSPSPSPDSSLLCALDASPISSFPLPFNFELSTINFLSLSPFPAILTGHPELNENKTTLSLAFVTLTSTVTHNPFACHSYKNTRGGSLSSSISSWHRLQSVRFRDGLPRRGHKRSIHTNWKILPSCQSPATNHQSPPGCSLFHQSRVTSHQSLSLLESALPRNPPVTPLESALPKHRT